jgi:tRNA 2-thiouridine synthesizing protein A
MTDHSLDLSGLTCPLPILKARKALKTLPPGARLVVLATDPGAPADFVAFCQSNGYDLVESSETAGTYRFVIAKPF